MKKRLLASFSLILTISLIFAFTAGDAFSAMEFKSMKAPRPDTSAEYAEDEIIVKFKDNSRAILTQGTYEISTSARGGFKRLRVPAGTDVEELVKQYRSNPNVEYAEPNYIFRAHMVPNDTYYSYQWHMPAISTESAWDLNSGSGVLVGIIDTGVAYEDYDTYLQAPDLAGTSFVAGYDFVNNDSHANDDGAHGTHVCGTIAQTTNNSLGCAGVGFSATIMPIKVLDNSGSGYLSDVADGIYYAADNGCQVINMSLGGSSGSTTLHNAIQYADNAGVTIVASAGNSGNSTPNYPAAYEECISVSATRYDDTRPSYSTYGSTVDICAPGGDLSVDQNGDGYGDGVLQQTHADGNPTDFGYYFYEGTSMAAPHVTGSAALVISAAGGSLSPAEVRNILEGTATDLGATGWDQYYGHGKVNAYAAVLEAQGGGGENPPVADFTGSPTTGDAPLTVNFTDLSSNDPTSWSWDFGDGGTSTAQNPSHEYTAAGKYTVQLTATNAYGSDTETKTDYITVTEAGQDAVHVDDIYVYRETWWWMGRGVATVKIVDQGGNPVSGATVYGTFTGPNGGNAGGDTGSNGEVTFATSYVWFPSGEWCFEVTDVVKSGWTYDSAANVVTKSCESGDVFSISREEMLGTESVPMTYKLLQNAPNPFNPTTKISFMLPEASFVRLSIYSVKGELVKTCISRTMSEGLHTYQWNASGMASGVYFYRLQANDFVETRKMLLLR